MNSPVSNSTNDATGQNQTGSKPGIVDQFIRAGTFVAVIYAVLLFTEIIYKYFTRMAMNRTTILPYTYTMDSKMITIPQNPNLAESKTTYLSQNERSGIEFTYSFYLFVSPSSFRTEEGLLHVFHKGYSCPFPLMAPGVFLHSETNTLRVYMNTFKSWNTYTDVENFPVGKWVHVAVVCKENSLEIFVNGNLSRKLSFDGFVPYQNFQDIQCFSQRRILIQKSRAPSLDVDLNIFGSAKGQMSRLTYFSYALSYAEIQRLVNEGPSKKIDEDQMKDIPPYLADTWWHNPASST